MGLFSFVPSFFRSSTPEAATAEHGQVELFTTVVKRMVDAINVKNFKGIQHDFGKPMLKASHRLQPFFEKLSSDYGTIKSLNTPRITQPNQAIIPAHFERTVLDFKIILDDKNKIVMLQLFPHRPDITVPKKNSVSFVLPFEGRWFVAAGGRSLESNPHNSIEFQRYGFDFMIKDDTGKSYSGVGKRCEDYYAFGKNVVCPADGVVTDVISGVRDNAPLAMNEYSAVGNCVIIQHAEYEVSVIAHFKYGSIMVKAGDNVKKAQLLGACGSSGHSIEPHIHYHLQNTAILQDGTGILSHFEKVDLHKKGKVEVKRNYSPVQGDTVCQSQQVYLNE